LNGEDARERRLRYFVRDDDVGELTDALRAFVELFVAHAIPVSYQIIPALFTSECAEFLLSVQRTHPNLVEFGQHGLRHQMTIGGRVVKREFGPERSFDDQSADIAQGLGIMRERLGDGATVKVFTPPQHKFDRNTVKAAAASGHRIFSASCYPTPHHQMAYRLGRRLGLGSLRHHGISYHGGMRPEAAIAEVSISIDVDDGKRRKRSAEAMPDALRSASARTDIVGLMFHHAMYDDEAGRAELKAIAGQLVALGVVNAHLMGALPKQEI